MSESLAYQGPEAGNLSSGDAEALVAGKKEAETPGEVYALVKERFDEAARVKFYVERHWIINTSHYMGEPNIGVSRETGTVSYIPKDSPWRVRANDTLIPYLIDTRCARVLRATPEPVVLPASTRDEDRYKAKLASKICRFLLDKFKFKTELAPRLMRHANIQSIGFLKVWFDPLGGENYIQSPVTGPDGQPEIDPTTGQPKVELIPEGEVKLDVVGPFELFPDPQAATWGNARYVIQANELLLSETLRLFPKFAEDIKNAHNNQEIGMLRAGIGQNILFDFPQFSSHIKVGKRDRVLAYEMWERATEKYPTGRHVIVIGKSVVLDEPTPEEYGEIPFYPVEDFVVPGRLWPIAVVQYLVPLQVEYNRRRSQIIENLNAHAWIRLLAPRDSEISTFAKDAHYIVEYSPVGAQGHKPEYLTPPSMPPEAFRQLMDIKTDMEEITGIHASTTGQNPTTARTGKAIWMLQEAADTRLEQLVERFHQAVADACTTMLKLVRTHYSAQRIMQVFVPHDVEVLEFIGTELGENVRVIIDPRAKAPLSLSQRYDLFMELAKLGAFNDPTTGIMDSKKLFEFMDLSATDRLFEDDSLHLMRARKELLMFRQGQPVPPPGPYEDHTQHLKEHRRVTNTDEWYELDPMQQGMWLEHIHMHEYIEIKQAEMQGIVPIGTADAIKAGQGPIPAPESQGNGGEGESKGDESKGDSSKSKDQGSKSAGVPPAPETPSGEGRMS